MTLTINLSDAEARTLQAKAEAEGLSSVEAWIQKLAQQEQSPPGNRPLQKIATFIVESMKDVPPDVMATLPADGASQHDHYIYGWPKREV